VNNAIRTPASADPVPSPCISVCRMDPRTGWCTGCWRTLDEIAQWAVAADDDKRAVWAEIERRRSNPISTDGKK